MPIFDHFDVLAPIYETFIQPKDPEEIIALAKLPTSGVLLDAGGGTGRVSQFFHDQAKTVVVADLSYEMLAVAREKKVLCPVCSHTEVLPFPDGYFMRVIMVDALHHVCDHRRTIDELWRVLQPGGRLLIEEPDVRKFGVKMLALGEKLLLMRSHFLSPERIAEMLDYTDADVRVKIDGWIATVIADKRKP